MEINSACPESSKLGLSGLYNKWDLNRINYSKFIGQLAKVVGTQVKCQHHTQLIHVELRRRGLACHPPLDADACRHTKQSKSASNQSKMLILHAYNESLQSMDVASLSLCIFMRSAHHARHAGPAARRHHTLHSSLFQYDWFFFHEVQHLSEKIKELQISVWEACDSSLFEAL